jgi:hypothetical protein
MSKPIDKKELEALLKKATEDNRKELEKMWKRIEDLEAAVDSAQRLKADSKRLMS